MNSTPIADVAPQGLEDLVVRYGGDKDIPVDWLTRLHVARPVQNLRAMPASMRFAKRAIDIAGSLAAILVLMPVALAVAIVVKCTSRGPAVYKQVRVGLNLRTGPADRRGEPRTALPTVDGSPAPADRRRTPAFGRPFVLYKFRTMVIDAERDGARLAARDDPRVTRIGRLLRRTRLDEILQFINVLRGEMSLVGPRPERPEFVERLSQDIPGCLDRLGLKPGITGLAQILNGYDDGIESVRRKVALDLLYLQNACVWNDLKILLRTVKVVITGHGAR